MLRTLVRLILVVLVMAGLAAFYLGYRWGAPDEPWEQPTGTSGTTDPADTSRARDIGAEVGETVAVGAHQTERAMANVTLTSKIKAKMLLDDSIEARRINVDTDGSIVTLSGTVRAEAERTRALRHARETEGVTSVVDRLEVR